MVYRLLESILLSQKIESRRFYFSQAKPSPRSLSSPSRDRNYSFPQQQEDYESLFRNVLLNASFFEKHNIRMLLLGK